MGEKMISYKKMSLFDAPEGAVLVHGCNGQGVWGSGIAKPFKELYPRSFQEYHDFCIKALEENDKYGAIGKSKITNRENKRFVGCLITSLNYGPKKDTPDQIIAQTYLALNEFFEEFYDFGFKYTTIYSNKFNSGMFKVPWEDTEKVLKYFVEKYQVNWIVCDPDME